VVAMYKFINTDSSVLRLYFSPEQVLSSFCVRRPFCTGGAVLAL
jgi:hypothetical protein